jgi:hypothetical protein
MKVAKIFWKYASLKKGTGFNRNKSIELGVDRRIWLDPSGSVPKANFLLVEFPMVFNLLVPIVDAIFEPPNNITWQVKLYTFVSPGGEFHLASRKDAKDLSFRKTDTKNLVFRYPPMSLFNPAPRWMEVLIELSRLHFDPLMDTDPVRALHKSVAFINHEDVLDHFAPREFERQSFMIAARWQDWESSGMTWDERAADLDHHGVTFNKDAPKNTDALEKRCRRLGLKRGDAC